MLLREHAQISRRRRVHDLGELMAIYECNYIRLRQLIPDLAAVGEAALSLASGALDLHLSIIERNRYTTTLKLTYEFADEQGRFPAPDIQVRIYHDARLAEVLSCGRRRGQRDTAYDSGRRDYGLDDKWRINRFLQKWLGYCLRQGHRFRSGRTDPRNPAGSWPEVLAALTVSSQESP
jgi:uncharacterized protein